MDILIGKYIHEVTITESYFCVALCLPLCYGLYFFAQLSLSMMSLMWTWNI